MHGNPSSELFWAIIDTQVLPDSWVGTMWDLCSVIFIIYDIFFIPAVLLELPEYSFFLLMEWMTRIFWTLDLPMNFFKAFIHMNGLTEVRHTRLAKRYVQSWFGPDLLIISTDWLEVIWMRISHSQNSSMSFGDASRISRIFRSFRVIRLARICRVAQSMKFVAHRLGMLKSREGSPNTIEIAILYIVCAQAHICVYVYTYIYTVSYVV